MAHKVIAEYGTGKTLISLGAMHVHSGGKPFTALAMVPPHILEKWAREAFQTIPGVRVFLIDNLRNGGAENTPHGVKIHGQTLIAPTRKHDHCSARILSLWRIQQSDRFCDQLFTVAHCLGDIRSTAKLHTHQDLDRVVHSIAYVDY